MPEPEPDVVRRLRELAGGPGYGLALIERGALPKDVSAFDALAERGVQVPEECRGAIGVLRGLETRCGPVLRNLALTGEEISLLHWRPSAPRVAMFWTLRVKLKAADEAQAT